MKLRPVACLVMALGLFTVLIYSCQKEPNDKIDNTLSSHDPQSLSASIRVWHGTRTQGNPPAQAGTALVLDDSNSDPIQAFAGRYAIIQPQLISGSNIKGYYVKLQGASEYFKVDYSQPRNINGRFGRPQHHPASFLGCRDSAGNGNLDSAIVIALPANLHVPDTFCVTYWAYDATNNVSNPVDVCIIVNSLGTDNNGSWLHGTWKFTASWEGSDPHDTIIYNKWIRDADGYDYCCTNAGGSSYLSVTNNGTTRVASDSIYYNKANLSFSSTGAQQYEWDNSYKSVNLNTSSCSSIIFNTPNHDVENLTGGWSFNSATNKITLIFEFDNNGLPVEEAWEYDVIKVSNTNFLLVDNSDPQYPYYLRMQK